MRLSRQIASLGIYPALDPLDSTSRILDPNTVGAEHYRIARAVQQVLQKYKDLQDIIAILGMDELSEEDRLSVARARTSDGEAESGGRGDFSRRDRTPKGETRSGRGPAQGRGGVMPRLPPPPVHERQLP